MKENKLDVGHISGGKQALSPVIRFSVGLIWILEEM